MRQGALYSWLRWAVVGVAVWFVVLVILSRRTDVSATGAEEGVQLRLSTLVAKLTEAENRLSKAHAQNQLLQKQVDDQKRLLVQRESGKFQKAADHRAKEVLAEAQHDDLYSLMHEVSKRSLTTNIQELYFYLTHLFEQNNTTIIGNAKQHVLEQTFALLAEAENFSETVDDAAQWHHDHLYKLSQNIQSKLAELQNPPQCESARYLLCDLNKGCGFGCQLHHVAYCFVVAAAANRTLLLEGDGASWRYSSKGWEAVFQPLGKCRVASASLNNNEIVPWKGIEDAARAVRLPIVDGLAKRPEQLPLSFPKPLAEELQKHHANPPAYFISQFIWYLMRNNENMEEKVTKAAEKIPFKKELIVGVQIRRTDKIGTEAAFHSVEEYMKWVEHWFRIQELRNEKTKISRRVFIATDDPIVFKETREKYPNYEVYGDASIAQTAQMNSRYSDNSLDGVVIDIQLLSRCDYLVCTFSSQVCRMGFELMQVRRGDAGHRFHSLDDIYYYGGQHAHDEIAVLSHKPNADNKEEMAFDVGDRIGIAGNHWDGFSKGINRRTGATGLYPSYKTREMWRIVDFPLFNNIL